MSFNCGICKKDYKSYKSYWSHNKNIHADMDIYISNKERNFICLKCNKKFTRKDSMTYHFNNTCKNKDDNIKETNINDIKELKKQVAELQKTVLETKNSTNVHTKQKPISECNYIYLIEKFDVNNNHFIYKFGKTNRPIMERIKEHSKLNFKEFNFESSSDKKSLDFLSEEHCLSSKILLILNVDNCNLIESNILKVLNSDGNITREKDIGNEYFYCNDSKYIIDIILKNLIKNDNIVV